MDRASGDERNSAPLMDIDGEGPSAGALERSTETDPVSHRAHFAAQEDPLTGILPQDDPLTAVLSGTGSQRATNQGAGEGRLSRLEPDLDGLGLTESLAQRASQGGQPSGQAGQDGQDRQGEVVKEMVRHFERISATVEAAVVSSEGMETEDAPPNGTREGEHERLVDGAADPSSDDPAWRRRRGGPSQEREADVRLERRRRGRASPQPEADERVEGVEEDDDEEDEISKIEEAYSRKHRPDLQAGSPQRQPRHRGGTAPHSSPPPHQQLQQLGQTVSDSIMGVARDMGLLKGRGGSLRDPAPQEDANLLGMPGATSRISASRVSADSSSVDGRGGQGPTPGAPGQSGGAHTGTGERSSLESLDYEVIENAVYREAQARKGRFDQLGYLALKWIFALLLGIATGLAAFFINVAVEILAGWKFVATSWMMQYSYVLAFFIYTAFNVGLVFSSATIITRFAPAAAGSGIPEIKGYLNGVDMPGILLTRTLVGKFLGSIGSVAGGLALGKEGPLVHTGACLAAFISQGGSTHHHLNFKWMKLFANDRDRRDMVTCGAAAGAVAAFRAPVGGVLFALEEVTSWWRPQLLCRVFFTSAVVAVVLRACMRWCASGECGKFASGGFIIWDVHGGTGDYFSYELLPMAMLGLMGGLLGALFNQLTVCISTWRRNWLHPKGNRVIVAEACLVALVTSLLSFAVPFSAPCQPCPDSIQYPDVVCPRPMYHWGNFVQFNCRGHAEYNDLATIFFNTQDDAIRNLFSNGNIMEYSPQSLIYFLLSFFLLAVTTYGIAVPSGQFVPGIMIGATYGRLVGMLMVKIYGRDVIDEGTYALLGAASFLGGSMRMTVSLCVIMVEITNNLNLLPLIMLVLLISKIAGDGLNPGFYDLHAHVRGIPILEGQPKRFLRTLTAKDGASSKVVYFARVEMVGRIVEVLKSTPHNGFPVIEDLPGGGTALAGLVLRSQLLVLLRSKADFQTSASANASEAHARRIRTSYSFSDFTKSVSVKGVVIGDLHLSHDDLTKWIDLEPFLNPTPYLVDENMSLTKVHAVFRSLGLRHLCVVPRPPRAVGIITRKDILPEVLEGRCAEPEELLYEDGPIEDFSHRPSLR